MCGGHGTLVGNSPSTYACRCTPPYYQGPKAAQLCQEMCPGTLVTRKAAGGNVTLCMCVQPDTNLQVLCSQLPPNELPHLMRVGGPAPQTPGDLVGVPDYQNPENMHYV